MIVFAALEGEMIPGDDLCRLTGLSDQRHRQLAKEGFFPPPSDGKYQFAATVRGLFSYYRESFQRSRRGLDDLKGEKLARENKKLDLEIARAERKLVPVADVDTMLLHVASLQKVVLYQKLEREMPIRTEGKPVGDKQIIGRGIADELCEIFSHETERWKDALDEPDTGKGHGAARVA